MGHRLTCGTTLMFIPIVGGILVTVMCLTPGMNNSSVLDTSGVVALGRASVDGEALTGFWAIFVVIDEDGN